jgi:hypothetical protein
MSLFSREGGSPSPAGTRLRQQEMDPRLRGETGRKMSLYFNNIATVAKNPFASAAPDRGTAGR